MTTLYRALLRLYPASYRAEYGDEQGLVFAQLRGDRSRLSTMFRTIADVVPNALLVHLDVLGQDIRFASRALRREPGFALTAILVVALGVGANAAAFSLAYFVFLRPLPYAHSESLVEIWQLTNFNRLEFSPPTFRDVRAMTTSFDTVSGYTEERVNLVGQGAPRRLNTARVMPDLMPMMGVAPLIGRTITTKDQPSDAVVVLSHDLWQSEFGGDATVIGRVLRLDGTPFAVIGVMPPSFRFPNRDIDLWIPLLLTPQDLETRTNYEYTVVARLKEGTTIDDARADVITAMARLAQLYPLYNENITGIVRPLRGTFDTRTRLLLLALCGATLCILLLACSNLAGLLLARTEQRTRELALRAALGAGRDRLVRQLVTESTLLALVGSILGIGIAAAGMPLLTRVVPMKLPVAEVPSTDFRAVALATALTVLTAVLFSVLPAVRNRKRDAPDSLREGTGSAPKQRIRSALVAFEVTGSIVLLVSCGLLLRAMWRIEGRRPGFDSSGVTTMRTDLPFPKYETRAAREPFYKQVLDGVRAIPGVQDAAYVSGAPMVMQGGIRGVDVDGIEGGRDRSNTASLRYVTPGFFDTLGIPLLRGRKVNASDVIGTRNVAVVSDSFAQRQWPGQNPIGRQFGFARAERTVVGVVGNVRVRGRELDSEPQVYLPAGQLEDGQSTYVPQVLVIRANIPSERLMPAVRAIVARTDPDQPIADVRTMSEIVADDLAPRRLQLHVLIILSIIALVIAAVGLHGLLSQAVSQRTQELGVRRALGAQGSAIVKLVVGDALRLTAVGAGAGVLVALVVARGMRKLLADVSPNDPWTIAGAVALCLIAALIGCLHPTRRATRIDPMTALRQD